MENKDDNNIPDHGHIYSKSGLQLSDPDNVGWPSSAIDTLKIKLYGHRFSETPLEKNLQDFVKECTIGRDFTHDYNHMEDVAELSMLYLKKLPNIDDEIAEITFVSGWLHDVSDSKYDIDGSLYNLLSAFLTTLYPLQDDKVALILNIIKSISFSYEKKLRLTCSPQEYWLETLGVKGLISRNVVSDADKYFAIGNTGFLRILTFTNTHRLLGEYKNNAEKEEALKKMIIEHSNEKQLIMVKEHYFNTIPGISYAEKAEVAYKKCLIQYFL